MATASDLRPSYRFKLEFDGLHLAFFQKVKGLHVKLNVRKYDDGGALIPTKLPGKPEYDDLELEYGATKSMELYEWFLEAHRGTAIKKTGALIQLDQDGKEVERWNIYGAWPVEFTAGEWDATSKDGNQIQKLKITYDYFKPKGY